FRLPTEAEWEYACRAGTTTRFFFGDALECNDDDKVYCDTMARYMWWYGNSDYVAAEVAMKEPNPWGLYDIHGNVWEICRDYLGAYLDEAQVDPHGPELGVSRVIRGGARGFNAKRCRSAFRTYMDDGKTNGSVGLRLVLEYP
ncbi:MAG TPA: formylglycine-generating enzyme family protein, partial [bacterium]|nr:formylglycine-generating enzyme family protein [bacterium]